MATLDSIASIINWIIVIAFAVCFSYQAIYFFARFRRKRAAEIMTLQHRYAVLIAARNEESVIAALIESIHNQTYKKELVDIYVVADNCTDRTAEIARGCGAVVYERFNKQDIGKGYALRHLLRCMNADHKFNEYDGFFIFDADNILDHRYIEEINKTFSQGYDVVTSLRNSSNLESSWISFGYGLWFLHESRLLNRGRMAFGSNAFVSGTGYLIRKEVLYDEKGWNWFLMTEDIQFTAECILKNRKIGYCDTAVFYDEQPTSLRVSFHQRMRWVKGYYQVFAQYGMQLIKKCIRDKSLAAYDMLMVDLPSFVLMAFAGIAGIALLLIGMIAAADTRFVIYSIVMFFMKTYAGMLILGLYTFFSNRGQIHCTPQKAIIGLLSFPIYMYTYFPIALAAFRREVEWKPIRHGDRQIVTKVGNAQIKPYAGGGQF